MVYIPIANKPLKYILQSGGSLTGKDRLDYLWRCKITQCTKDPNEYATSLQANLQVLKDIVAKKIVDVEKEIKITSSNTTLRAGLENIKNDFQYISEKDIPQDFGLSMYNIKSLQYTILLDNLFYLLNPDWKSQYARPEFVQQYKAYIPQKRWLNSQQLYNDILNKNLDMDTLIQSSNREKYCCPVQKNSRILVALGEMTLSELVESLIDDIFLLGITTGLEWADGNQYTPLEFLHHDITHANNYIAYDTMIGSTSNENKEYIRFIIKHKEEIDPKLYDIIMIALFIILHETNTHYILRDPIKEYNHLGPFGKTLFNELSPGFLTNIKSWKNTHFLGGLLPPEVLQKNDAEVHNYLEDIFETFRITWNNILTHGVSSLLATPQIGRNSIFFMGDQEETQGNNKKILSKVSAQNLKNIEEEKTVNFDVVRNLTVPNQNKYLTRLKLDTFIKYYKDRGYDKVPEAALTKFTQKASGTNKPWNYWKSKENAKQFVEEKKRKNEERRLEQERKREEERLEQIRKIEEQRLAEEQRLKELRVRQDKIQEEFLRNREKQIAQAKERQRLAELEKQRLAELESQSQAAYKEKQKPTRNKRRLTNPKLQINKSLLETNETTNGTKKGGKRKKANQTKKNKKKKYQKVLNYLD